MGKKGPWVLFVGWVAPREFYGLYNPRELPLPKASKPEEWPHHPWLDAFRRCFITDQYFTDETRRIALASYYGLVSFMDSNVGKVLSSLHDPGRPSGCAASVRNSAGSATRSRSTAVPRPTRPR